MLIHPNPGSLVWPAAMFVCGPGFTSAHHSHHWLGVKHCGHSDYVFSVAWSPDGGRLATGSKDRVVKVWDAASGQQLLNLIGHSDAVRSVAWSPDATRLAAASIDETVQVYATDVHVLLDLAHSRITGDLTPEECKRYLRSEKCPDFPQ